MIMDTVTQCELGRSAMIRAAEAYARRLEGYFRRENLHKPHFRALLG